MTGHAGAGGWLDVGLVAHNVVRRDGQGRVMLELARAIRARGHRVTVYSRGIDDALRREVEHRRIRRFPGPQLVDDVVMFALATLAVRRARHDVTVVLGPCALPRSPYVVDVQYTHAGFRASWTPATRPGWYHRLHTRFSEVLERLVVRKARGAVASTPRVAGEIAAPAGVTVEVVPNGVDRSDFPPPGDGERERLREGFGLRPDDFAVAFLGDYKTPRKGLETLLEAIALGPAHERLVVAARGNDRLLEDRVQALGLADRVVVAGFAPPRDVLAACDAAAVPSLYEPFSLVALEATAVGVPVVISECAGAAPLLGDGGTVVLRPDRPEEIRTALDSLEADPPRAAGKVAAAREATAPLTWEATAADAAAFVESVARGVDR